MRSDMLHIDITAGLTLPTAGVIRYARRLRFVAPESTAAAVQMLVAIAALRARGAIDKFPLLCDGTEPAAEPGAIDTAGVCLDTLRRAGEDIRRALRSDNRAALADRVDGDTFARLLEADAVPVEQVLVRLGARSKVVELPAKPGTPEHAEGVTVPTEVWHCPRPERHTNGDANPSSRVIIKGESSLFQCFRCDPERVGALRLVMDVRGVTGAEAADWILAN